MRLKLKISNNVTIFNRKLKPCLVEYFPPDECDGMARADVPVKPEPALYLLLL